jgi:hypothetical protein
MIKNGEILRIPAESEARGLLSPENVFVFNNTPRGN